MAAPGGTGHGSGVEDVVVPLMTRRTGGGCDYDGSPVPAAVAAARGRVWIASRNPRVVVASGHHSDIWQAALKSHPGCGGVSANAASSETGIASRSPAADGGRRSWLRAWRRPPGQTCTGGAVSGGPSAPPQTVEAGTAAPSATYQHSRGRVTFWRQVWSSYAPSVGRPMRLDGVVCTSRCVVCGKKEETTSNKSGYRNPCVCGGEEGIINNGLWGAGTRKHGHLVPYLLKVVCDLIAATRLVGCNVVVRGRTTTLDFHGGVQNKT
ncbi:hypothetical protein Vafri_1739 [Volvox africanus]|nr:hypothetical protein Vafri_1739 [Volvox africanus]